VEAKQGTSRAVARRGLSYVAETGSWEQFGPRLWTELWERGLGRLACDLVVVADGADHIDQAIDSELRLPGIHLTRILDIAHARASSVGREQSGFR
jgi:hypothetical protein